MVKLKSKIMEFNVSLGQEFADFFPIEVFYKNYKEEGIIKSSIVNAFNLESPDKNALIIFRTFIQKSEKAKSDQKYIIGLRFYSFGDMATIDLISLDKEFHREICYEHLKRMNFPLWGENMEKVDHYQETTRAPVIFTGGHLKILDDDSINFFGDSGDYTGKLLFSDCNSLARYICSISGVNFTQGEKEPGKNFVEDILKFMFENKQKNDFYQKFIANLFQKEEIYLNSQNIGALIAMKVIDRHLLGEGELFALTIDEISAGGLTRDIMLHGIARRMRAKE
jgi:hypothetical protein